MQFLCLKKLDDIFHFETGQGCQFRPICSAMEPGVPYRSVNNIQNRACLTDTGN